MATFLFWNLKGKDLEAPVAALCHEHDVDVLILAESGLRPTSFLTRVNAGASRLYSHDSPQTEDVARPLNFFSRLSQSRIPDLPDGAGVSVRLVAPPVGKDFLLVAVHLPDRDSYGREGGISWGLRLSQTIGTAEAIAGHRRTVAVGDFNMNPFDDGMVRMEGLHAVMDRAVADRGSRRVQGVEGPFFYNPMWGRLGDGSPGPPGTHYYRDPGPVAYFWNTYDQVLVRPELLTYFPDADLQVLTRCQGASLLAPNGRPDKRSYSDLLPLRFTLQLERNL